MATKTSFETNLTIWFLDIIKHMLTVQVANEKELEADIGHVDKVYFDL